MCCLVLVKLKDWAREHGVSYRAALNWFHAGTLPAPARQLETGTILVEPAAAEQGRAVAYCRVMTEVLTSMCARLYGRRSASKRAKAALRAAEVPPR